MKIPQEDDRYSARKYVIGLGVSILVCFFAGIVTERFIRPSGEPDRRETGRIYTGLMSTERDGPKRRERDRERLESWGWVSSSSIHMPIERAIELSLPRLLVERPEQVGVDEHLGASVPLDAVFTDTEGHTRRIVELCDGSKPVLLALAYERCPMLCGLVLRGAAKAVKDLGWKPGERFRAVTVSFDPEEKRALAERKHATLIAETGGEWPFLAGHENAIRALTDAVGFRYYRDPASGELAHPAVLVVLTPEGKISRYLYGVEFRAKDLELALVEAGEGKTGSALQRVLLRCYRWDGTTHRYQLAVLSLMRATGAVIGVAVFGFMGALWRRERRGAREEARS